MTATETTPDYAGADTVTVRKVDLRDKINECTSLLRSRTKCPDMETAQSLRGQIDTCEAILNRTFGTKRPKPVDGERGLAPNGEPIRTAGAPSQYGVA